MTLFLLLAAAMLALALLFVLPVLWRRETVPAGAPSGPAPRDSLNLAVLRDQLRELELDFRLGSIGETAYQHARRPAARRNHRTRTIRSRARRGGQPGAGDRRPDRSHGGPAG